MNRLLSAILLLIVISQPAFSQKLKKKVSAYGKIKEVYYVDKKTQFKNGISYTLNTTTKDTLGVGKFKNEMQIGIWKYFDVQTGEKFLEYNYSNDSLLYLNNKCIADSFLVEINGELVYTKVDRPLLFLGYTDEFKRRIHQAFKMPKMVWENEMSATALLSFKVDNEGNIISGNILKSFNRSVENQIHKAVMACNSWILPPIIDGKSVPSQFYVRFNLNNFNKNIFKKELPYLYEINYGIFKKTSVQKVVKKSYTTSGAYPNQRY